MIGQQSLIYYRMNDYLHFLKTDFDIVCMQRLSQVRKYTVSTNKYFCSNLLGMWKSFLLRVAICQTLMLEFAAAMAWPRDTYSKYKSWFSNSSDLDAYVDVRDREQLITNCLIRCLN